MTRLQRGIGITLGAKLALLALLYALFFSPADRPAMTPCGVAERLLPSR